MQVYIARLQETVQNNKDTNDEHIKMLIRRIDGFGDKLEEILKQTTKTNGRVNRLEAKEEVNKETRASIEDLVMFVGKVKMYVGALVTLAGAGLVSPLWYPLAKAFVNTM